MSRICKNASDEAKAAAVSYLIRAGETREEAIIHVARVTPQRVHQLARLSRGLCSICLANLPGDVSTICEACRVRKLSRYRIAKAEGVTT